MPYIPGMARQNNLRQAREAAGRTQQETAVAAEIALSYYQRLEAGGSMPGLPIARAIAAALDSTVDTLWPTALPAAANE